MKEYTVYYVIKMNGHAYMYCLNAFAPNSATAVKRVRDHVFDETGRNAFTATTTPPKNPKIEVIKGLPPSKWKGC